ncbi:MAG: hypothetical protein ACI4L7_03635 [Christensenellales bacterium]
MENYDLQQDEVVLYKGKVVLKQKKGITELILTNKNFVLITTKKKLFAKAEVFVDTYPVKEIKYYKDNPQVIRKGQLIELYFLNDETEFMFESKSEARIFVSTALNLLTNKTTFERTFLKGSDKIKNTISMVDKSLGVDTVGIAKNVIKNGMLGKTTNVIGKGVKVIGKFIGKK